MLPNTVVAHRKLHAEAQIHIHQRLALERAKDQPFSWSTWSNLTPGCALLNEGNCSTGPSRNASGAWFQDKVEIQTTPACSDSSVFASAADLLSSTI